MKQTVSTIPFVRMSIVQAVECFDSRHKGSLSEKPPKDANPDGHKPPYFLESCDSLFALSFVDERFRVLSGEDFDLKALATVASKPDLMDSDDHVLHFFDVY